MFVFYSTQITDSQCIITDDEYNHCIKVLRYKLNDEIFVTNGVGYLYKGVIISISKTEAKFEITDVKYHEPKSPKISVAVAPPKSGDRLEFLIEKATEIGVHAIHLFESKNTERSRVNLDRLQKIALSAIKQSKQYHLPFIDYMCFSDCLAVSKEYDHKYVAHCGEDKAVLNKLVNSEGSRIIYIGPEGDFTQDEISQFTAHGVVSVTLGKNILRTETAVLYAAAILSL